MLRKNDRAAVELALTGAESNERLIELMADHPTLLQRPIGVLGGKAIVGRPPENLLALVHAEAPGPALDGAPEDRVSQSLPDADADARATEQPTAKERPRRGRSRRPP